MAKKRSMKGKEVLNEYLEISSHHGLNYLSAKHSAIVRLFWVRAKRICKIYNTNTTYKMYWCFKGHSDIHWDIYNHLHAFYTHEGLEFYPYHNHN